MNERIKSSSEELAGEIRLVRSERRSVSIQVKSDCSVIVRAPIYLPLSEIQHFVDKKEKWISETVTRIRQRAQMFREVPPVTDRELRVLHKAAKDYIPVRVEHFAKIMGVTYRSITIRTQKTRWGSCSARGGLNFNCLLMKVPAEVLDYVIVHELCHRKHMNHSKYFWAEVAKIIPDYSRHRKWLRTEGSLLMQSLYNYIYN